MKIVLDTNVLVAGLLSPFGSPGEIVRMVSSGELTLCIDARVMGEYREVLSGPKFAFDEGDVAALLDFVEFRGDVVASSPLLNSLSDSDDEPFLEIVLASDAEYLVTGNQAHFPPALCDGAEVVSPGEFLMRYRERRQTGKSV